MRVSKTKFVHPHFLHNNMPLKKEYNKYNKYNFFFLKYHNQVFVFIVFVVFLICFVLRSTFTNCG